MVDFNFNKKNFKLGVIGLGYIGATLALEFSKKVKTIGYDISASRVDQLKKRIDRNLEISKKDFEKAETHKIFTNVSNDLSKCNIFIITVPTPVTKKNKPDLKYIKDAIALVCKYIKKKDIIVLESTVYPGLTENLCNKYIQSRTKLKFNKDFFCGYSPERVNPGDKKNNLKNLTKVISGSNNKTKFILSKIYGLICNKIYVAENIKIAESAKIIENCQRDINIAYMNELRIYFDKININMDSVIEAASTKWNFLKFHPGLVGGHCIGVDPYYLIHDFKKNKINTKILINARETNHKMTDYFLKKILEFFKKNNINSSKNKIALLGGTFKENCPDQRNSKNIELALKIEQNNFIVSLIDPYIDEIQTNKSNNIKIINKVSLKLLNSFDALIYAVPHREFLRLKIDDKINVPKFYIRQF